MHYVEVLIILQLENILTLHLYLTRFNSRHYEITVDLFPISQFFQGFNILNFCIKPLKECLISGYQSFCLLICQHQ